MTTDRKNTPFALYIEDGEEPELDIEEWTILDMKGVTVATIPYGSRVRNGEVNSEDGMDMGHFIVRACNAHYDMLEALKTMEFSDITYNTDDSVAFRACPSCGGPDRPDYVGPEGHCPNCFLRATITKAEPVS